jgi:putative ABC transport system permease protein
VHAIASLYRRLLGDEMFQDLRFSLRMLLKNRGFTLIAALTLALGVGANTAVFSVAYATLLRPLPFRDQERLVVAWKSDETTKHPFVEISIPEFNDWRSQNRVFEHLAAMTTSIYGFNYTLTGLGEPEQIHSARVSADFFPALGVEPAIGRAFTADEDRPGAAGVAVISHSLWQRRFNADPNLIGQTVTFNDGGNQSALEAAVKPGQPIKLNDVGFTIVGVMPPDFEFLKGIDMWVPLSATSGKDVVESRIGFLQAVGRLKPSASLEQATAELDAIIGRIAAQHPEMRASGERAVIKPLAAHIFGDARPALYLLLAATALLLLIACANIANLQLARATSRRREIALRAALGAGRGRLARQLMVESLALAVAGGGLGVLLAYWILDALVSLAPADIPRIEAVEINLPALLFTCGLTLLSASVCGFAPALIASKVNLVEALNAGAKIGGERRGKRLRGALAVAQIAVTLALLIGAGLISRSLLNLQRIAPGFDQRDAMTFQLQLRGVKYPDVEKTRDYFRQLLERIEAQPGVVAAGAVLMRPLEAPVGWYVRYATDGQSTDEMMRNAILNCVSVTPHYLRAIGTPLKAGRDFTEQDDGDAPQVAIISETMARSAFAPGVDPIGKRVNIGGQGWRTIVGVAGDARLIDLKDARWNIYVPYRQFAYPVSYVAIRAASDPAVLMAAVRREVAALDPEQTVMSVMTMGQRISTSLARPRFNALLLNLLSALAAALAAVGIYGVISYSVAQRTREIGVRLALGAKRSDVLWLVIKQGMALAAVGVAIGLAASLALTRLMQGLLYGLSATDLLTFAGASALLGAVAVAACWLPARRATKVDPMMAMREE